MSRLVGIPANKPRMLMGQWGAGGGTGSQEGHLPESQAAGKDEALTPRGDWDGGRSRAHTRCSGDRGGSRGHTMSSVLPPASPHEQVPQGRGPGGPLV